MIKKLNILLAVVFAAMFALKAFRDFKAERAASAAAEQAASAKTLKQDTSPVLNVYYTQWEYFCSEDPISNRNGLLLDTVRAIFPNARFFILRGDTEQFARKLREEPNAVVVGFGAHVAFKEFRHSDLPMAWSKIILFTLRTNPWRYTGPDSLDGVKIVVASDYMDFDVLKDRYERFGPDSPLLRVLPSDTDSSMAKLAAMVESGEADGFVESGDSGRYGIAADMRSMRLLQNFRKSDPIGKSDMLFFVSSKDAAFADRVLEMYDAGMRRIEASGERRRIFEYYGMTPEAPPPADNGLQ